MKVTFTTAGSLVLVAALVLGSFAPLSVPTTQAAAPVRKFSASASPATLAPSTSQSVTFTFVNDSTSDDPIKSARIELPSGFTLQNPPAPALSGVTNWEVCNTSSDVQFGKDTGGTEVAAGASFSITMTVSVPATTGSYTFVARAFKNDSCNPGGGAEFDTNLTPITLAVQTVNTVPVANPLSITTNQNTATSSMLTGSDADSNPITFGIVGSPTNGLVSLFNALTGAFTYTPTAGFSGSDSFTFAVNDGTASSTSATVSVTVNAVVVPPTPVSGCTNPLATNYNPLATVDNGSCTLPVANVAPVASALSITTAQDTATSSQVSATDANNDPLTFATTSNPTNGTLTFNTNGTFTYTPNAGFSGTDSFTFVANDGAATSTVATTTITVTAAPVTPTPTPTPTTGGGGNGGGGGGGGNGPISTIQPVNGTGPGLVLGAETESCDEYLQGYIHYGRANDSVEVTKLQSFLNNFEGYNLAVSGSYDQASLAAVHAFQTKYANRILAPWGATQSTGYVYYTTRKTINEIYCAFTKEFPLSATQEAEIARIKAAGETYSPVLPTVTPAPQTTPTTKPQDQVDENAVIGGSAAPATSQTAAAANAVEGKGWWDSFLDWLFGR